MIQCKNKWLVSNYEILAFNKIIFKLDTFKCQLDSIGSIQ